MPFSKSSLKYVGGIRTPHEMSSTVTERPSAYPTDGIRMDGMNMGGRPFAIDYARKEFVVGSRYQRTTRLKMVDPAPAIDGNVNTLPIAPYVDGLFHDMSNDTWEAALGGGTGPGLGGLLPYGNRLLVAGTVYYDGNGAQPVSMLSAEWPVDSIRHVDVSPWRKMGSVMQGIISGPMAPVLGDWATFLPGDVISGQAGLPIIMRNSAGPCAFVFKGSDILTSENPPATMLVGYPMGHWMPGHPWDGPGPDEVYTQSTTITGMAFVGDYLVFAGTMGNGIQCYGNGTQDPNLVGKDSGDGSHWCYDPYFSAKGNHSSSYRTQLWVYTKDQIKEVLAGTKNPWDLIPEVIPMEVPFHSADRVVGLAYDPSTRYLYLGSFAADGYGYEPGPVYHVYEFTDGVVEPPPPPPPPPPTDPCVDLRNEVARLTLSLAVEVQRHQDTKEELAVTKASLQFVTNQLAEALQKLRLINIEATAIVAHNAKLLIRLPKWCSDAVNRIINLSK